MIHISGPSVVPMTSYETLLLKHTKKSKYEY